MGYALVIPHTDFSSVATKKVEFKNEYNFDNILSNFINVSSYNPSNGEIEALEHLTYGLWNYDIWDKIDALYLLLGNTYSSCRYSWKNPNDFIAETSDNGQSFSLTSEHRIDSGQYPLFIRTFDDFNPDDFHSLSFLKTNDSVAMFPLSVTGFEINNVPSLYFVKSSTNGVSFQYRDHGLESTQKILLNEYYDNTQSSLIASGLFNKNENTIKYCSCEFTDILSNDNMPDWSGTIDYPFYLNGYHNGNKIYGNARIMGFGKFLTETQMKKYMQLLNIYIEETANIYS